MNGITIAILAGLMGMIGFGISDFVAKKTIDKIGNIKTLFYAQLFGAIILLFYLIKDPSFPIFNLKNVLSIVIFGFFNTLGYLSLYRAFEKGKLSVVSPISSSSTILTAVVSFFFLGEKFSQFKIVTLIIIILGIILTAIDLKSFRRDIKSKNLSKGVPDALMVLLIFGVYVPFWAKFIAEPGWAIWVILVRVILCLFLLTYQLLLLKSDLRFNGLKMLYLLVLVSIFEALGSLGSSWGYHSSIGNTSIISALVSTYPLMTAILAFTFLKERLAVNQYFGIALIILGLTTSAFL